MRSIDFSKKMKIIDSIIVNSDSKRILRISKKAGANILVSGTTVFKENEGNIKANIEKLKSM